MHWKLCKSLVSAHSAKTDLLLWNSPSRPDMATAVLKTEHLYYPHKTRKHYHSFMEMGEGSQCDAAPRGCMRPQ